MADARFLGLWLLGLRRAETQTTPAEQAALARLAAGRRLGVEIGVYHAVNTKRISEAMARSGVLYAVDPFPPGRIGFNYAEVIARCIVMSAGGCSVKFVKALGSEAGTSIGVEQSGRVDLMFIDGDHSYEGIRSDWEAWRDHVAPGGIIAFHDSYPVPGMAQDILEGSVRYVQEVVAGDGRFGVYDRVGSLTAFVRR